MTEHPVVWPWLLAVAGGGAVAVGYLASLWWIVQRVPRARYPAALVAGSALVRVPLAALALVAAAGGNPFDLRSFNEGARLLAALLGFLVIREVVVRSARGATAASWTAKHGREGR